jgi:nucleoid-associated protein YgaU
MFVNGDMMKMTKSNCETPSTEDGVRSWVIICLFLWVVAIGVFFHLWGYVAHADSPTTSYIVKPGDTVWHIALGVGHGEDPRNMVDSIISINHLSQETLSVGQVLRIPMGNN